MLKKILIALVILVAGFAGVVAMQPSEFKVERTATIAAPPANVFQHVDDLHKWDAWSPWAKLDPNAKATFDGEKEGQGAGFAWAGNDEVGEGRMTITDSKPHEQILIRLEFIKPFAATNTTEFTFRPVEGAADQTQVTWTMTGHNNFISKAFCMFMNMDKMVGGDFEKGLASMKAAAEAEARAKSQEPPDAKGLDATEENGAGEGENSKGTK